MRTAIIIVIGFIVLAVCVLGPRLAGRPEWSAAGAKVFIALWLALALFALPSAVAAYVWWKFS